MKRLLIPLVAVAGLVAAPTAHADQWEFISHLDNNGVLYANVLDMIDIGKGVCAKVRSDPSFESVDDVGVTLIERQGFAGQEAGIIMAAAAQYLCPDIWPALRNWHSKV